MQPVQPSLQPLNPSSTQPPSGTDKNAINNLSAEEQANQANKAVPNRHVEKIGRKEAERDIPPDPDPDDPVSE